MQDNLFPIYLIGHSLKYEIECIFKLFFPLRRYQFFYDEGSLPQDAEEGAEFTFTQTPQQSVFSLRLVYQGKAYTNEKAYPTCDPATEKSKCEFIFAALLLDPLKTITGKTPPWGILTGIRPVKKVQPLLRAGKTKEEIFTTLSETYQVTTPKLELAYLTAVTQEPFLAQTPKNAVSLYISIPFCPTRCSYCSFVSHSIEKARKLIPPYLEKLVEELKIWSNLVQQENLILDTVYFGGGTPTTLEPKELEQVMTALQEYFDLSHIREYCVEAGRPDTITREKLEVLKRFHVTRISVNPQTMHDSVLQRIGRKHTVQQTIDAFQLARAVGFDNINMDLIAGLPGDTVAGFQETLQTILAMDPDSITVHALSLKRSATLFSTGEDQLENPVEEMVRYSYDTLTKLGYMPYYMYRQKNTVDNQENVAYAKPGKESLYNILIMDESQSIFAAGAAGSTKLVEPMGRITRLHNYKFPYEYIDSFDTLMEKKQLVSEIYAEIHQQEAQLEKE